MKLNNLQSIPTKEICLDLEFPFSAEVTNNMSDEKLPSRMFVHPSNRPTFPPNFCDKKFYNKKLSLNHIITL